MSSSSFRILTLSGFLLVPVLGFSTAHAATFVTGSDIDTGGNGRCVTVEGLEPEGNRATIGVFPCTASFRQVWTWEQIFRPLAS